MSGWLILRGEPKSTAKNRADDSLLVELCEFHSIHPESRRLIAEVAAAADDRSPGELFLSRDRFRRLVKVAMEAEPALRRRRSVLLVLEHQLFERVE